MPKTLTAGVVPQWTFVTVISAVLGLLVLGRVTSITQDLLENPTLSILDVAMKPLFIVAVACMVGAMAYFAGRRLSFLRSIFDSDFSRGNGDKQSIWRWALLPNVQLAFAIQVVNILLQVATLAFGTEENGSRRWLDIGVVKIQTSELARLLYIASWSLVVSGFIRNKSVEGAWQPLVVLLGFFLTFMFTVAVGQRAITAYLINFVLCFTLWFTVPGIHWTKIVSPRAFKRVLFGICAGFLLIAAYLFQSGLIQHVEKRVEGFSRGYEAGLVDFGDPVRQCTAVGDQFRNKQEQWVQAAYATCKARGYGDALSRRFSRCMKQLNSDWERAGECHAPNAWAPSMQTKVDEDISTLPMQKWQRYSYYAETTDFVTATVLRNFGVMPVKLMYIAWILLLAILVLAFFRSFSYGRPHAWWQLTSQYWRNGATPNGTEITPPKDVRAFVLLTSAAIVGIFLIPWYPVALLLIIGLLVYLWRVALWFSKKLPMRLQTGSGLKLQRTTAQLSFATCYIMSALTLVTVQLVGHIIVNVLPIVTGVPLPLVSRGGSSLWVNACLLGYAAGLCVFVFNSAREKAKAG